MSKVDRFHEDALDVPHESFGPGFELGLDRPNLLSDRSRQLTLGAEDPTTKKMQVEVIDGHPGCVPYVESEPVAALPNPLHARNVFGENEEAREEFGVVPLELTGAFHVLPGNDQAVDWRARVDITNREGVFVLGDELDGDLATGHTTEEAVLHLHESIVDALPCNGRTNRAGLGEELQTVYSSAMAEPNTSVLSHFWSPLCAVGSHGENGPNAQICVSVFGASIVPVRPRLLVVLSNTNYTTSLVSKSKTLSVTVLSEDQAGLLEPLGLRSGRDGPKLDGLAFELTDLNDPVFPGGAGWVAGEVLRSFDLGDSTAFLVAVVERSDGAALPMNWQAAKEIVGEAFLSQWAEKSVREQAAARNAMLWR